MPKNFQWAPGGALPSIEEHSLRKLAVLKNYLDVYFDTVVPDPRTDRLNITLVDGFCGGGLYKNGLQETPGSPLVLLNSVEAARERLNEGREKPLEINARFFFVDENTDHVESLRQQIRNAGFGDEIGQSINLINGDFAAELPGILEVINTGQRAGRSIFVLDQFGYSDVPMQAINSIFTQLNRPEVLLTFAIDSMLNYLRAESAALETYRQFGVDNAFIEEWNANKEDDALGRAVTQRMVMCNIQSLSGAEFFTPFMLWSPTDNRWMMFAHLSRHQAARDKMLGVHWNAQNSFRHIGQGSLFSLGFDARLIQSKDALFNFGDQDKKTLKNELLNVLPNEIRTHMIDDHVSLETLLSRIGNKTAATNEDLLNAIEELVGYRDLNVVNSQGVTKRAGSRITLSDGLIVPRQTDFFRS